MGLSFRCEDGSNRSGRELAILGGTPDPVLTLLLLPSIQLFLGFLSTEIGSRLKQPVKGENSSECRPNRWDIEMASHKTQQLIKSERHFFSSSDDSAIMKQILATHHPDGRDVDCRPLLNVIEDIFLRSTPTVAPVLAVVWQHRSFSTPSPDACPRPSSVSIRRNSLNLMHHPYIRSEEVPVVVNMTLQISYKCSIGGDGHAASYGLFDALAAYSWETKAVLALAAFATLYGEFWLVAQLHTVNPLARSVALMKQLPNILEHSDVLKPRIDAINSLIKAMVDVARCAVDFNELPAEDVPADDMTSAMNHIPTAAFWIVRSIVACTNQIVVFIGLGHEYITAGMEVWELSSLEHKLRSIHEHLTKQYAICQQHIDDKRQSKAYDNLANLFKLSHIDNMRILKAMIHSKDNLPLIDLHSKKRFPVDVLRRKTVILFISDLDISHEELFILVQIYNDTHQGKLERNYEILWLPVTDRYLAWTPAREEEFNRLASMMPWYSLYHPSLLETSVIKYIRDVWNFEKKTLLVVLDPQGKVVCPNAHHMMWIWGSVAFPFTTSREEQLWKDEIWRLEFLVDEIDAAILQWVKDGRYVCLYGGEDIEWIRKFTATMRRVAMEAGVALEMVYVGKSNPKERVKKAVTVIANEKLSGYWQDPAMVWFFWMRLESMWHSKMQHSKDVQNDLIMQEVVTMLSFDGSEEGWALVSRGGAEIAKAHGRKIVDCLSKFETWKANIQADGFVPALASALLPYKTEEHCTRLVLPEDPRRIREHVICADCKRPMEKYVLFKCCNN
ncbi:hypothetical protein Taro_006919 [Colocasia esculenta]|uniref:Uncharacterized protein n=1 Tax=Colocasia esculenta TaxID=4460 RepID=A0A843TQ26_COLES|nr:hypothetical protein [Colocasia esculenta]